jgi:hypothetical protein
MSLLSAFISCCGRIKRTLGALCGGQDKRGRGTRMSCAAGLGFTITFHQIREDIQQLRLDPISTKARLCRLVHCERV